MEKLAGSDTEVFLFLSLWFYEAHEGAAGQLQTLQSSVWLVGAAAAVQEVLGGERGKEKSYDKSSTT